MIQRFALRVHRARGTVRAVLWRRRRGIKLGGEVGIGPGVRLRVAGGGELRIGHRSYVDEGVVLQVADGGRLIIGDDCFVGHHSTLAAQTSVIVGDGTSLAEMVSVRDHDHTIGLPPGNSGLVCSPVRIGRDVWIGGKASVLRGVNIGDGAVIGAHSLVRTDVPARHLAVGVPAVVRRSVDPPSQSA